MNNSKESIKSKLSKDVLYNLYVVQNKPMHVVADELGVATTTVYNYIKKHEIPSRDQKTTFTMKGRKLNEEQRNRISKMHKGKVLSKETRKKLSLAKTKGGIGHKKRRTDGYMLVYFPDHPNSEADGYIMEHIVVMEALVGRHLERNECVHHINHKRDDNRKENLKLMTKSEHMSMHMKERYEERRNGLSIKLSCLAD